MKISIKTVEMDKVEVNGEPLMFVAKEDCPRGFDLLVISDKSERAIGINSNLLIWLFDPDNEEVNITEIESTDAESIGYFVKNACGAWKRIK